MLLYFDRPHGYYIVDKQLGNDPLRPYVDSGLLDPAHPVDLWDFERWQMVDMNGVEEGLMIENLMIATQALGIGGHPFSGGKGRVTLGGERHWHEIGGEGPCGSLGFTFHRVPDDAPVGAGEEIPVGLEGIFEGACPPFHADMDAAVDFILDQRWGERGIFSAPEQPADPVALAGGRARGPPPVGGGDRSDQDPVPLHLEHLRALPGDDRPLPDDGLVPGRAPRRRVLRPLLPAGGAAGPRALAHARLARRLARWPRTRPSELGDLELELGGVIPGGAARRTGHTGRSRPDRGNAILFAHMYSGTPASLDPWIGARPAARPRRGGSSSARGSSGNGVSSSPSTTRLGGPFPELTIADDVAAQHRLVSERLGIERLALALGFSMGAQQAYEWAVRFPEMVGRLAVFAGLARTTPANDLLVAAAAEALASGAPRSTPTSGRPPACRPSSSGARPGARRASRSVADLVTRLFVEDFARLNPADLLAQLAKWRRADVARHTGGDLAAALGRITARTVVAAFSHDDWFPAADCRAEQELVAGSSFRVVRERLGPLRLGHQPPPRPPRSSRIVGELLAT